MAESSRNSINIFRHQTIKTNFEIGKCYLWIIPSARRTLCIHQICSVIETREKKLLSHLPKLISMKKKTFYFSLFLPIRVSMKMYNSQASAINVVLFSYCCSWVALGREYHIINTYNMHDSFIFEWIYGPCFTENDNNEKIGRKKLEIKFVLWSVTYLNESHFNFTEKKHIQRQQQYSKCCCKAWMKMSHD